MKTKRSAAPPESKPVAPGNSPLVTSAADARREAEVLKRGRERLEDEPRVDETSARTGVVPRRTASS
jgi:hypothetical protein